MRAAKGAESPRVKCWATTLAIFAVLSASVAVAVAIGGHGYYGGYGSAGNRYYGNRSYGGHRRHHYYDRY
jgi:hypothetical protein